MPADASSHGQPKCTLLLSGGADSATLAGYLQQRRIDISRAVFVDYGQPARKNELTAATKIAGHYDIEFQNLSIVGLSSCHTGFVFGRNAWLLLLTASLCHEAALVAIAVHGGTPYADCSPGFISQIQDLFDLYSEGTIRVLAPFLTWSKQQILDYGASIDSPLHLSWSCEAGDDTACGECTSCLDMGAWHARKGTSVGTVQ